MVSRGNERCHVSLFPILVPMVRNPGDEAYCLEDSSLYLATFLAKTAVQLSPKNVHDWGRKSSVYCNEMLDSNIVIVLKTTGR